jgi:hypothetical protein
MLALGACAGPSQPSTPAQHAARRDVVIEFGDMSVRPAVARVKQGGSVAWTSTSTTYQGMISFHHGIVESFSCQDLRPTFFEVDEWLVSIPIRPGGEDLVLPCPLEPGTYPYRVNLSSMGSLAGMGNPQLSLEATLIVE